MKYILLIFICGLGLNAFGQHDPNDEIISLEWIAIGNVTMKTVKPSEIYAVFNAGILKQENKKFELQGYIVPLKDNMKQSKFMLSTLPINQCFFCGQNGIPMMVLVEMATPIKFTYNPVTIRGTLKLSRANTINAPPIVITSAELL
jgi:hypothetical protein